MEVRARIINFIIPNGSVTAKTDFLFQQNQLTICTSNGIFNLNLKKLMVGLKLAYKLRMPILVWIDAKEENNGADPFCF